MRVCVCTNMCVCVCVCVYKYIPFSVYLSFPIYPFLSNLFQFPYVVEYEVVVYLFLIGSVESKKVLKKKRHQFFS